MASEYSVKDAPLLFALDEHGNMRHVDDVARGKACGCICPNERCKAPLIARHGDVMMHSFAHASGHSCDWAIESAVTARVFDMLRRVGFIMLPAVVAGHIDEMAFLTPKFFEQKRTYYWTARFVEPKDMLSWKETLCDSMPLRLSGISQVFVVGRSAPAIIVEIPGKEMPFRCSIVVTLAHPLTDAQKEELLLYSSAVLVVDLALKFKELKEDASRCEGRHFDRAELLIECQSDDLLKKALFEGDGIVKWAYHLGIVEYERAQMAMWAERYDAYLKDVKRRHELERQRQEQMRAEHEREMAERARKVSEDYFERMTSQTHIDAIYAAQMKNLEREREVKRRQAQDFFAAQVEMNERALAEEFADERHEFAERELIASRECYRFDLASPDTIVYDQYGNRLVLCYECQCIGTTDDFVSYGGPGRVNIGHCHKCVYGY